MENDPSELDLSEELDDLTELLVRPEPEALAFLHRLLSLEPGTWHPVRGLLAGLDSLASRVAKAEDTYRITLQAIWNPCPEKGNGAGWALVVFYSPEWHGVANTVLVNKRELAAQRN